jgi:predicted SprT family Zn-dependent metalloprotease
MFLNRNHQAPVQFVTIAHELAHLFLGHLGQDIKFHVTDRRGLSHDQVELEAESVAYLVCARNGVKSASETYLTNYVKENTTITDVDVYQVMRAAGQVETTLNLGRRTKFHEREALLLPLSH